MSTLVNFWKTQKEGFEFEDNLPLMSSSHKMSVSILVQGMTDKGQHKINVHKRSCFVEK